MTCYWELEIKSLAIHSICVLHLHWDPGGFTRRRLGVLPKFKEISWLYVGSYWLNSQFARSGTVTTRKLSYQEYEIPLVNQMLLDDHTFSHGNLIEVGLSTEVLVEDWFLSGFATKIIHYDFVVNQWKIAWSLYVQYLSGGNKFGQLSCANTMQGVLICRFGPDCSLEDSFCYLINETFLQHIRHTPGAQYQELTTTRTLLGKMQFMGITVLLQAVRKWKFKERIEVVKLKPPWPPPLGMCMTLSMGNLPSSPCLRVSVMFLCISLSNWLQTQSVGGRLKLHAAFLFSRDRTSTIDSMPVIKHISSRLSEACVLYIPATSIVQCGTKLM